jgi:synaptobrevin family protein YKT6
MKILSIHVFSLYNDKPIILSSAFALSFVSIFQRGTLKDFLNFHSRLVIERVAKDTHAQVQLEKGICYAISNSDKIGVTMICDEEYPKRVAIDFLLKIHDNFKTFLQEKKLDLNMYTSDTDVKYDYIANEIEAWQDPSKKDSLMKLQNELNDVTDIMRQNLNELLKREENLESLMQKSNDLSATSVNFYKQAKKTNSCCNL